MGTAGVSSSSPTILEILKEDCMLEVFSYLSVSDLVRSQRVSKAWSKLVLYKVKTRRYLNISIKSIAIKYKQIFNRYSMFNMFMKIGPNLHCLKLNDSRIRFDNSTPHLIAEFCPNLQELFVYKVKVKNWKMLPRRCKYLKSVSFKQCPKVTDTTLSKFAPVLEELHLTICKVSGLFLVNFVNSHLRKLELSDCKRLKPSLLRQTVGYMKNLISFTINHPSNALMAQLNEILVNLPQLQEFSCCHYSNQEGNLIALTAMKDLRQLYLRDNKILNDRVLQDICTKCTRLQILDIAGFASLLTSPYVWKLPELEELRIDYIPELPLSSAVANGFKLKVLGCFTLKNDTLEHLVKLCPDLSVLDICEYQFDKVNFIQNVLKAVKLQLERTNYLTVRLFKGDKDIKEVGKLLVDSDCRLVKVFWKSFCIITNL